MLSLIKEYLGYFTFAVISNVATAFLHKPPGTRMLNFLDIRMKGLGHKMWMFNLTRLHKIAFQKWLN